jgi:rRNA-processing protein EBP2
MLNCKPVLHSREDVFGKTVAKMCQLTCLGGEDRKMGKKQGRKREREEEEDEEGQEIDLELEAELAALQQIQHEKEENDNEDSDEDDEGIETGTKKTNYNKEGLVHCNESLGVTHLPFIETMSICEYELHVEDENDDLEREMAFYNHAIQAVNIGRMRFADLKIPFRRPDDYFCESLKSDAHMARVIPLSFPSFFHSLYFRLKID